MPFNTTARDALSVGGNKPAPSLRDGIEGEYVWTPQPSQTLTDFVPGLTRVIAYAGKLFMRDDADTTTPHDGVATIVTQGGVRFKVTDYGQGPTVRRFSVLAITTTPPASPSVGDTHIIGTGATGVWSGKDTQIAHRTSAGWVYVTPKLYDEAHNAALSQIYHFNASSAWVAGVPALTLSASSVHFTNLRHGLGQAIENQTTNAPPGSPADGVAYIIGGSPTGAWSGHALKFTEWRNAAWEIVTPKIGWKVYDKAIKAEVVYAATGWTSLVSGYSAVADSGVMAGSVRCAYSFGFSGSMTYVGAYEVINMTYTPRKAGAIVEVDFHSRNVSYDPVGTPTFTYAVGLFIDSEATTTNWIVGRGMASAADRHSLLAPFRWTAPDTSLHTLRICSLSNGGDWTHRHEGNRLIIRERA